MQAFSTDLAMKIEAGFDSILSNQIQKVIIPELHLLKTEIENLGKKLQDSTTGMSQNVVNELESALSKMMDEFKISVSGSTKSELKEIATLLGQAGSSLIDFPAKVQEMTEKLNKDFRSLQEVVQQIAKQTLAQSNESTEQMKKQVEEMSEILKTNVGELQIGQEVLITKQSENLQILDKLFNAFSTSIKEMNSLSINVTETILRFNNVQNELNLAAGQLKLISENMNNSSSAFKDAQLKFSQHSNQFLENNSKTIEGHTDNVGDYYTNMELSQDRTRSVLSFVLDSTQLDAQIQSWVKENLTANGLSYSKPIADNNDSSGRELNRRVEFRIRTNAEKQIDEILIFSGKK